MSDQRRVSERAAERFTMNQEQSLRHLEEEAQKRDIVSFVSLLTNERPEISQVVKILETSLQAAYERGFEAGRKQ